MERFTPLARSLSIFGLVFCTQLLLPDPGTAAWPEQTRALVQPVLVTALALTSLVLFLIYVFIRKQAGRIKSSNDPTHGSEKPADQEADLFLNRLFDDHALPMVKLSLDQTRILDATPVLAKALGYSKTQFLRQDAKDLGIAQTAPEVRQSILDQGWYECEAQLYNRESRQWSDCRILSILIRSARAPFILSIVSGLSGTSSPEKLPGCIKEMLDRKAVSQ